MSLALITVPSLKAELRGKLKAVLSFIFDPNSTLSIFTTPTPHPTWTHWASVFCFTTCRKKEKENEVDNSYRIGNFGSKTPRRELIFFFLAVPSVELRASCLLGRSTVT
jgi:hypothetical protein